MFSKNAYSESFRSFYTFYLIERFGLSIEASQLMLFVFLAAAAVGVLVGGIIGDRIGRYRVIWFSILGPLPLTILLPYVDLFWTGVLTIVINDHGECLRFDLICRGSAVQPDPPDRRAGWTNFGLAGLAAAILGGLADTYGVEAVFRICSFLPLAGLLAWFLPRTQDLSS